MNENLNLKILEFYVEIDKIHDNINNKLFNFITKANELVEMSEDDYQIERTLKLNKISLKGYVLDSKCCISLNDNNISNYSITELKDYLIQYEKQFNEDCSKYFLAISLYETIEKIENQVDNKINLEINKITELVSDINNIKNINSNEYEALYKHIKNELTIKYLNLNLLDDKSFSICVQLLNDIFNYYINGYPNIPEEYLYKEDD